MIEGMTETECHSIRTEEEGVGGTVDHPGTTVDPHQGMTADHHRGMTVDHPGMTADLQLETTGGTERLLETEDLIIEINALIRRKWVDYKEREAGIEGYHPEMIEEGAGIGDPEVIRDYALIYLINLVLQY